MKQFWSMIWSNTQEHGVGGKIRVGCYDALGNEYIIHTLRIKGGDAKLRRIQQS